MRYPTADRLDQRKTKGEQQRDQKNIPVAIGVIMAAVQVVMRWPRMVMRTVAVFVCVLGHG